MADVRSLIVGAMNEAVTEIRMNMSNAGENASGRTSASFRVEDRGTSIVLVMGGNRSKFGKTAPLETLEVGSRPGVRGDWFKSVIHQWTIDKGMSFENESHRWAVSTVIARNIEESGTKRLRNHVDIYTLVTKKTTEKIRSILSENIQFMMSNAVISHI